MSVPASPPSPPTAARPWPRLAYRALPLFAAVAFGLFSNAFTPVNTDLGWMLDYGRTVAATGKLVQRNHQSFTEPNRIVVRHDWATCMIAWAMHRRWGAAGLVLLKWLLVLLAILGIGACVYRVTGSALVRLVVLLLAVDASWICYELLRAQLFTFVFLPIVVYAALTGRRRWLWLCVPLIGLWANFHGGWIGGFAVLTGLSFTLAAERRLGWAPPGADVRIWEALLVPVLAAPMSMATPFGYRTVTVALEHLDSRARLLDREWLPLWHVHQLVPFERHGLVLLGVVAVVAIVLLPRRQLRFWALLVGAEAMALSASRQLRLAPILLAPVVAVALARGLDKIASVRLPRLDRLAAWAAGMGGAALLVVFGVRIPDALHLIDYPLPSPVDALAVMHLNHLYGNVWNDFDWGGLLIWAVPEAKVAADGRHLSAYSPSLIAANIRLGRDGRDPVAVVRRYGADLILLPPSDPAMPRLRQAFHPLYCDPAACLLSDLPDQIKKADAGLLVPTVPLRPSDLFESPKGPWAVLDEREAAR